MGGQGGETTDKETSCFQTGLWADKRPKRLFEEVGASASEGVIDERLDDIEAPKEPLVPSRGLFLFAASWAATLDPITPRAERAVEGGEVDEKPLGRFVGVPLTSLSVSGMGSRLMNSFCSNWTTT